MNNAAKQQLNRIGSPLLCPQIVLLKNGRLLRGMRNYTPDKWKKISTWTTPGGRCDEGETLGQALRREIEEEVGITDFEVIEYLGDVPGAKEGDVVPLFVCTTAQEAKLKEPEKFSEWRWFSVDEYLQDDKPMNPAARELISKYLIEHESGIRTNFRNEK